MIKRWIKKKFKLYEIEDLQVGGHCGLCGARMEHEILPKSWPWSICQKCSDREK